MHLHRDGLFVSCLFGIGGAGKAWQPRFTLQNIHHVRYGEGWEMLCNIFRDGEVRHKIHASPLE